MNVKARPLIRATTTHAVFGERARSFARTVDHIERTYGFVTPEDFFGFLEGESLNERAATGSVLMTFDDGLRSSCEFIRNELTPRGIHTIVFVPTAVLTMNLEEQLAHARWARFPGVTDLREEQYLTIGVEDITGLVSEGHSVMPHSHTHARLSQLTTDGQLLAEIAEPKRILEGIAGTPMSAFAYPYGGRTAISASAHRLIESTYRYCFTAIGGRTTPQSERLLLRRDNLDQTFDIPYVEKILSGRFDSYNELKFRLLSRRLRRDSRAA